MKPTNEINWEQRRFDAAVAAMQGFTTGMSGLLTTDQTGRQYGINQIADCALLQADALIAKLKESNLKEKQDEKV